MAKIYKLKERLLMIVDTSAYKMNLQGIKPFNESLNFYYDETGNCRKFCLTGEGFNNTTAATHNFILGGIAIERAGNELCFDSLYSGLGFVEGEQKELKFKNLFHNSKDFIGFMESKRATVFFSG